MTSSTPTAATWEGRLPLRGLLSLVALIAAVLALGAAAAQAAPVAARGFELVSPQDKGNTDIAGEAAGAETQASLDGNSLIYSSSGAIPGAVQGGALPFTYRAIRTGTGWGTEGITPASRSTWANCGTCSAGNTGQVLWLTPDLSRAVVASNLPFGAGASDATNLFTQTNPDADRMLLTPGGPSALDVVMNPANYVYYQGATPDLRHVVFATAYPMAPGTVQESNAQGNLYEATGGTVRLVSIDENGDPITGERVQLGTNTNVNELSRNTAPFAISRDGSRIFFSAGGRLYVRKDGTQTDVLPGTSDEFYAADPSGSRAVFLYAGSGITGAIQVYDVASKTVRTIDPCAGACSFVGASDDLSRVYFVDDGTLPGQPTIPSGSTGFYVWNDDGSAAGTIEHIATVGPSPDGNDFRSKYGRAPSRVASVTPDGATIAFAANGTVNGSDNNGTYQVYVYDAGAGHLSCVSCPPEGPPTSDAFLYDERNHTQSTTYQHWLGNRNNVSSDGHRVFFQAADALVPQDTNGKIDVYVWEGGAPHLVSSGTGQDDARFLAASPSGDDAFFVTRNKLVAADRDDFVDVYDARVGGGFPPPSPPVLACQGDACQASPSAPPAGPALGSVAFSGSGNSVPAAAQPRPATMRVAKVTRRAIVRMARTGRLTVRVTVSRPGRVVVAGRARVAGRRTSSRVFRAVRTARRAGTVRVRVRLSKAARRSLASGHRLAVHVTVTQSKVRGARRAVLRLAPPHRGRTAHATRSAARDRGSRGTRMHGRAGK